MIDNTHLDDPSPCEVARARGVTNDATLNSAFFPPLVTFILIFYLKSFICSCVWGCCYIYIYVCMYHSCWKETNFHLIINCKAPPNGENPSPRAPAQHKKPARLGGVQTAINKSEEQRKSTFKPLKCEILKSTVYIIILVYKSLHHNDYRSWWGFLFADPHSLVSLIKH